MVVGTVVSGKWLNVTHYGVRKDTETLDMDMVRDVARAKRPDWPTSVTMVAIRSGSMVSGNQPASPSSTA